MRLAVGAADIWRAMGQVHANRQVKLFYYRYPNFGDTLNETLFGKAGYDVAYHGFDSAEMIAVGSILDMLVGNSRIGSRDKQMQHKAQSDLPIHVWGTGLMYQYGETMHRPVRPLLIHALRGELTRRQMSRFIGSDVSCALADPGLLSPYLVPAGEKKWDFGIVAHYVDAGLPVFEEMAAYFPNSLTIDVSQSPEVVLKQISQCRAVFSTSLHGIIVADAYGVPSGWCVSSDKILGNNYKYHDYFSAFGTDRKPFDLREGKLPDPDKVCRTSFGQYREVRDKQKALWKAFLSAAPKASAYRSSSISRAIDTM